MILIINNRPSKKALKDFTDVLEELAMKEYIEGKEKEKDK